MAGILDTNLTTSPAAKATTAIGPKLSANDDQIRKFWTDNKIGQGGMKDSDIADAMDMHGVTPERLSQVMGADGAQIAQRYSAVRTPVGTGATKTDAATMAGGAAGELSTTSGVVTGVNPVSTTAGTGVTKSDGAVSDKSGISTTASTDGSTGILESKLPTTSTVPTTKTTTSGENSGVTPVTTSGNNSAGIIDTKLPVTDKLDSVKTYNPDIVKMEDADTVESRIANIIKSDSPLMQLARTRALQQQNSSGTLNSSMAIGAGENAVFDKAQPIATQDAITSSNFKLANQGARNTSNQFSAGEQNRAGELLETGRQQTRNIESNTKAEKELQAQRAADTSLLADKNILGEKDIQTMRDTAAGKLADKNITGEKELQTMRDTSAGSLADKNIAAEAIKNAKVIAAEKDLQLLRNSNAIDVTKLTGQTEKEIQSQRDAADAVKNEKILAAEKSLQELRNTSALDVAKLSTQTEKELQTQRESAASSLADKQIQAEKDLQNTKDESNLKAIQATGESQKEINELQNVANKSLTELRGKYDTLATGNTAAANLLSAHSMALAQLMSNPDIPVAQKQQMVNQLESQLVLNVNVIGKMNGIDYGSLLTLPGLTNTTDVNALGSNIPVGDAANLTPEQDDAYVPNPNKTDPYHPG